jgi:pilus assembly protein CpaE
MLRSVIISPDVQLAERLEEVMLRAGRIGLAKSTNRYLSGHDLERFLRANAPQVIFISTESLNSAIEVIAGAHAVFPGVQFVAIDRVADPNILLDLMRAGVREFLAYPFDEATFAATAQRLESVLERNPAALDESDNVLAFLPAKAGCGTSTIALNTAIALSRLPDMNVLLSDMDLNSGLLGFMLKTDAPATIYEAAEHAHKLDEHLWPQLVTKVGKLDLLAAGKLDPQSRIDPMQIRQILSFARRFYKVMCIDLSGNMEKFSIEVMQEAKRIFVVATPEIPSLHLARKKIQLLQSMDLAERTHVLLNRASKRNIITTEQIQQLLGVPVFMEFPNDYRGVHVALTLGKEVDTESELGKQFQKLAYTIADRKAPGKAGAQKSKFMDFFNVLPRYSLSTQDK